MTDKTEDKGEFIEGVRASALLCNPELNIIDESEQYVNSSAFRFHRPKINPKCPSPMCEKFEIYHPQQASVRMFDESKYYCPRVTIPKIYRPDVL